MKPTRLRMAGFLVIIALIFVAIVGRLASMQTGAAHDDYVVQAETKSQKTFSLTGKRGTIYDANMIPLAYDRISYNVQFYRDPTHGSEEYRRRYTQSILEVIRIVEANGKEVINDFWLSKDENGNWYFDTGTTNQAAHKKRIDQWRGNFYLDGSKYDDPNTLYPALCEKYCIPEDLSEEETIKVLAIWQEQRMNNFTGNPVTIAYDVSYETVAQIEAISTDLLGMSIQESSTRVYPLDSLGSHTVGYVGKITSETSMAEYEEKGYPKDALVGQSGIEASLEDQLTPYIEYRQGSRTVERNRSGKIIRELSYEAPVDGNSVILTLDSSVQAVAEQALEDVIGKIQIVQKELIATERWQRNNEETLLNYTGWQTTAGGQVLIEEDEDKKQIQLAQTGALVAMDPNTGRVLAMASYPDFDLSMFEGEIDRQYWNQLIADERKPMLNRAISARDTPGSIFKLCTSLGSLMEGVITTETKITDMGGYDTGLETDYKPSCWIDKSKRWQHTDLTVSSAITHSCNYFFYTVGQGLGSNGITKWAAQLGLTSKTGIELNGESTSFVGNQEKLYDSDRAYNDQYTAKPEIAHNVICKKFREIGEDRGIVYDQDRMDRAAKMIMDLANTSYNKSEWPAHIRDILMTEMGLPSNYIANNLLVNEFYSYVQDLRWTDNETIMAAIGQSITQITPVAACRYVAAIANGGTVFNAQLIDKIISPTGEIILDKQPTVANTIEGGDLYFEAIRYGMAQLGSVENDGSASEVLSRCKYPIGAKTGTSQRTDLDVENNAWLVAFAPVDNPQIAVAVYIQNGYAGAQASQAVVDVVEAYLDNLAENASIATIQENTLAD
ncbi:MAG: hypothetical protein IJE08_02320 [Clostridia bacterium]|nr:hypothetical protein [Clostridia bacterium]